MKLHVYTERLAVKIEIEKANTRIVGT